MERRDWLTVVGKFTKLAITDILEKELETMDLTDQNLMPGHIYKINFLHQNARGSKKGKEDKKGKISIFFCLFCFLLTIHHEPRF
jgi:hypothetical protein